MFFPGIMDPEALAAMLAEQNERKSTRHGHCWLCGDQVVLEIWLPAAPDTRYTWHCKKCDVREVSVPCSCGVEPADAA